MRPSWFGKTAALIAAGIALASAKPVRMKHEGPQARRAPASGAAWRSLTEPEFAVAASLWTGSTGQTCRVPARWAAEAVAARLGGMMRVSTRGALRAAAAPASAGVFVAREMLEAAFPSDADVASQLVTMDRGAPAVVRVLRAPAFRRAPRVAAGALAA